jgi:hypothetical protein
MGDLLSMACGWGRWLTDGLDSAVDTMDDDDLFNLTGYRRKPPSEPETPMK